MPCSRLIASSILTLTLLAPRTERVHAQTADDLFDVGTLQEIRLFISARDVARLRTDFVENTYYTADLVWRDLRVRNVGVRSRGVASRNPVKLALQIDFNRYASGQRFLGLKALVLDNSWRDPAFMRERLASAFFSRMGQAAPRESYCRLYINHEYQGLYTLVEPVDMTFIQRALDERGGYLFEYHYRFPFFGEDLGDDLAAYKDLFEPRSHELESDEVLYAPIRDLFREVNHADDAVWRQRVEERLDVRQFITHVAIEQFLAENDGILGAAGMANFYLYRSDGSSRHRCIPWDKDTCFAFQESSIFRGVEDNVLARRLLAYRDLRALFLEVIEECARRATEDDWLLGEVVRDAALITPAVLADSRKQYSNDDFLEAIEFLKVFARTRPAFVLEEIARTR